jgi:hypothetical protein
MDSLDTEYLELKELRLLFLVVKLLYTFSNLKTFTMETTTLTMTWEEYTLMLSALKEIKDMVDSDKLDALYIKLYVQMNATKIRGKS